MIRNIKVLGTAIVAVLAFSALAASGAQANPAHFKVPGALPLTLAANGVGLQKFVTSEGTSLTCPEVEGVPGVEGSAEVNEAESTSLTVSVSAWNNCHATILKIPVEVDMNGCQFTFTPGKLVSDTAGTTAASGNTSTGSVHIVNCDDETKGITVTVGENGKTCHIDVLQQEQQSGSVHYHTRTDGSGNEYVESTVENVVVKIDTTGGTACSGGTENPVAATATYNGAQTASATGRNVTIE